jgi:hypothetical protein
VIRQISRLFHTVRYLTPRQIAWRVSRAILRQERRRIQNAATDPPRIDFVTAPLPVTWESLIVAADGAIEAEFLSIRHRFPGTVDWACFEHGLLWNYHLHYLNWLNNPASNAVQTAFGTYMPDGPAMGAGNDPYPSALRIINVVKAVGTDKFPDSRKVYNLVASDVATLSRNIEYHLLGNHLLENGFGLLWGGVFLNDRRAFNRGKTIVLSQLTEQILNDGGHFERSPMYHSIILWRLLDTINLIGETPFQLHASRMLGWLHRYPLDGIRGHMNDSAPNLTPSRDKLLGYGRRLGIKPESVPFDASGFRLIEGPGDVELLVDAGTPSPSYQPGHAHAGTLGFELYHGGQAILVDTGTSTYERCPRRDHERSTRAHNTVSLGRFDSSEVWAAFRLARRARVTIHEDKPKRLTASHDGYGSRFGIVHTRSYDTSGDSIVIADRLAGPGATQLSGTATFIAAPGVSVRSKGDSCFMVGSIVLRFSGAQCIRSEAVDVAAGFNRLVPTTALRVRFRGHLRTSIQVGEDPAR